VFLGGRRVNDSGSYRHQYPWQRQCVDSSSRDIKSGDILALIRASHDICRVPDQRTIPDGDKQGAIDVQLGPRPWQLVAAGIFTFRGQDYHSLHMCAEYTL